MNTHGHKKVAESAGILRLQQAFKEIGIENVNLNAFYLGNWLTDTSQLNDPVAGCFQKLTSEIAKHLEANMGLMVSKYASFIKIELARFAKTPTTQRKNDWVPVSTIETPATPLQTPHRPKGMLDPIIEAQLVALAQQYVENLARNFTALAALLKQPAKTNAQGENTGNSLGDALIYLVRFGAYSKFAHPNPTKGNAGIPYPIFDKIFKSICVQYYPHEHLDRPECRFSYGKSCTDDWGPDFSRSDPSKLYSNRIAAGGTSLGSKKQSMYQYLSEDLQIASSLLCEVDRDWANVYLTTGKDLQKNEGFHLGLAKLGHALHAAEDFFAHSNFIEHAAMQRGDAYITELLYDSKLVQKAAEGKSTASAELQIIKSDNATTKILKRLKRYSPDVDVQEKSPPGWSALPDETSVVTGYFDCHDTIMSVSHVLEEVLGLGQAKSKETLQTFPDILMKGLQDYAKDRLDEFKEPTKDIVKIQKGESVEAKARQSLITILDCFSEKALSGKEVTAEAVESKIVKEGHFPDYHPEILRDIVAIVIVLCTATVSQGRVAFNAYQLIKTTVEFFENPLGFLIEPLTSPLFLGKFGAEVVYHLLLKDKFEREAYNLREWFAEIIGAYRVGSHSLLAKDYESEPLYRQMFNCAKTLHWYVVDTLCRWGDPSWTEQAVENTTWVDWGELLGYFLRHPMDYEGVDVKSYIQSVEVAYDHYVVTSEGETFRSIHRKFSGKRSVQYKTYTYEMLLEANLSHLDVSQLRSKDPVAGFTVGDHNIRDLIAQFGLGTSLPNGSYELKNGLLVLVPFAYSAKRERVAKGVWHKDVMDLTEEKWTNFVETYRVEKSQMSFPAYQYHKWRYFEGSRSGRTATQVRDSFIEGRAVLRKQLEQAYSK